MFGDHDPTIDLGKTIAEPASPGSETDSPTAVLALPEGERYQIGAMLGRGGMGEVRLARDARIEREVAIKRLLPEQTHNPDAVARFIREALVQGGLDHPAVVPIHDLGVDDEGTPYFVMKRLTGTTLFDIFAARAAMAASWPRRILLARLVDICLAVEFAHTRGVVHRDLKPGNIMLGDFGEVYILDWGIARVEEVGPIPDLSLSGERSDVGTMAGAVYGTPGYMSPEQARGLPIDYRTDVFALGCILFEILTGATVVPHGANALGASQRFAGNHRPSAAFPAAEIPPELDDACARATESKREHRYDSVRELAVAIQAYLDGDRDLERRRALAADHAAIAQAALGAVGDQGRAIAMREAGRSLALDATNHNAQAVLGRLLIEAPRVPQQVVRTVDAERVRARQSLLRIACLQYLVVLAALPFAFVMHVHTVWPWIALATLVSANAALTGHYARRSQPIATPAAHVLLWLNTGMLAVGGVIFSPVLLLPFLAISTVSAFVSQETGMRPVTVLFAHFVALALPLGLEWTHVLPSTFSVANNALTIHPWVIDFGGTTTILIIVGTYTMTLVNTWVMSLKQRRLQNRAQDRLHVQAWHLSQLLPP